MKRTAPILALGLIILLASASVSLGQVQTWIRVIQASSEGSTIDPSLADVHHQLGSLFSFTSYQVLRSERRTLSPNQTVEIPTHSGSGIEITLLRQEKNMAELRLRVKRGGADILNTQVRLFSGRTVLIGGPRHGEGVVIFALSARF